MIDRPLIDIREPAQRGAEIQPALPTGAVLVICPSAYR